MPCWGREVELFPIMTPTGRVPPLVRSLFPVRGLRFSLLTGGCVVLASDSVGKVSTPPSDESGGADTVGALPHPALTITISKPASRPDIHFLTQTHLLVV